MKKILLTILTFNVFGITVFAEELRFEEILSLAEENSYKLKMLKYEQLIAKNAYGEAFSAYYPSLSMFGTTERYNDLTDRTSQITAVGNEILLNRSYYQDMAAIGLSYKVFDFGERYGYLNIAKSEILKKDIIYKKEFRDLHLNIVDLYGEVLNLQKKINVKTEVLNLYKELNLISSRLRNVGELSAIELVESEINVVKVNSELDELKNSFSKKMAEVSYYTNKNFEFDNLELLDFTIDYENIETGIENFDFDIENSLEAKISELEISKKQKEYEIQKKSNYPKIRFDTRYNFYGSDPTNFFNGVRDISQRSVTFRLSATMVLFDGFKNINSIKKKKLEVERMKVERAMQLAELRKDYTQKILDMQNYANQIKNFEELLMLVNKNLENINMLNASGNSTRSECLKRQISLLQQKESLEQMKINNIVSLYKLDILLSNL